MLSNEAFNALLKTLEEPPPHVKFIFATTHAHKVPPTILSRCQRFDFRRIPTKEILVNLKKIVKEEKLAIDDDALGMIAKYGDGSMRDAQVILDQIASFTEKKVGAKDVTKILGVVDDETLFALSGAIYTADPKAALHVIDELVNGGKDVMQAVLGLIEHFRNISIAKVAKELDTLIDAGSDKIERYREESAKFTIERMLYIIYTLSNTIDFMRKTDMARIPFEAALVKLTLNDGIVPITDIIKRVEALEGRAMVPEIRIPAAETASAVSLAPEIEKPGHQPSLRIPQASGSLDEILSSWTKVISYIKTKKISIASYLQEGDPVALEGNTLTLGFAKEFQFHKEVLESSDNKKTIETAIKDMLGLELRVLLVVTGPVTPRDRLANEGAGNAVGDSDPGNEMSGETTIEEAEPIVRKAIEMFGGKLAGINGKGAAR